MLQSQHGECWGVIGEAEVTVRRARAFGFRTAYVLGQINLKNSLSEFEKHSDTHETQRFAAISAIFILCEKLSQKMELIFNTRKKKRKKVVSFSLLKCYLWEPSCKIEIYAEKHMMKEKYGLNQANKQVLNS